MVASHGIKGTLKVVPYITDPVWYKGMQWVMLADQHTLQRHDVQSCQYKKSKQGGCWHISLVQITTRTDADRLKGCVLMLPPDQIKPPSQDSTDSANLIGCVVYDDNGTCLGTASVVFPTGANEVLEVMPEDPEAKSVLIPLTQEALLEVDLLQKRIRVDNRLVSAG